MEIIIKSSSPDVINECSFTNLVETFRLHRELQLLGSEDYIRKYGNAIRSRVRQLKEDYPLFDVVVSAYNEESYLPACLNALSRQTVPIRVLVVDNNSTDQTADMADRLGVQNIVKESQPGIGAAKKTGVLATSSPLFLMTDADSAPMPTWASSMLRCISRDRRFLAAYSPVFFHDANSIVLYGYMLLSISGKLAKDLVRAPHYQGNSSVFTSQVRDWLKEESDPQAGDDGPVFKLIKRMGQSVVWNWDINSVVFTSARRVKNQGLRKMLARRIVHLVTGNSDFAYYSLYSDRERGLSAIQNPE